MARSIAVDATEAWRAVIVMKNGAGNLWYEYQGLYAKKGTAKARITYYRDHVGSFYDGWVERADITWEKLKD